LFAAEVDLVTLRGFHIAGLLRVESLIDDPGEERR
jgi:hypothetical protein